LAGERSNRLPCGEIRVIVHRPLVYLRDIVVAVGDCLLGYALYPDISRYRVHRCALRDLGVCHSAVRGCWATWGLIIRELA